MTNVLVSLIGDQNAPNVFLIKDVAFRHIDWYLFITTPRMEEKRKLDHLLAATGLPGGIYQKIIVQADDILDIHQKLEGLMLDRRQCRYHINLTGGTKLMSIALFAYFGQPAFQAGIYYLPVGKNTFQQIFPFSAIREERLTYQADISTYLAGYGFEISQSKAWDALTFPPSVSEKLLQDFLSPDGVFRPLANAVREQYNSDLQQGGERVIALDKIPGLADFLQVLNGATSVPDCLQPAEIRYLIGGWFEEWACTSVQSYFGLRGEEIAANVRICNPRTGSENEFDLLFMRNNTLFVLECKSGLGSYRQVRQLYENALYRLDALRQKFGMNVNAGFLTLSDKLRDKKGRKKKAFFSRASAQDVIVLDRHDLTAPGGEWPAVFRI